MRKIARYWCPFLVIAIIVCPIYWCWRSNPPFFDDIDYLMHGLRLPIVIENWQPFMRRWIPLLSLGATWEIFGWKPEVYRVISLGLHIAVACSLFFFVSGLMVGQLPNDQSERSGKVFSVLVAVVVFSVHPMSAFAVGYLIQQSILLASLFSIWMWIAIDKGVKQSNPTWLALSVLFFYLSVCSKEHAITAMLFGIVVAWNACDGNISRTLVTIARPFTGWLIVSIGIILTMKGFIGSAYEPLLTEMSAPKSGGVWMLSAINQAYLWFKYLIFWICPYENWMSIDLRMPFPDHWYSFPWLVGAFLYIIFPIVFWILLWFRIISRLVFIGFFGAWLLYFAQFSAIQYQESFVLYRSYFFEIPLVIVLAYFVSNIRSKLKYLFSIFFITLFLGMTWGRLQTFSHSILIWDEAVARLNGNYNLPGAYRIFHNRGLAYAHFDMNSEALADFSKSILLNPEYPYVYSDRGLILGRLGRYQEALDDYDNAIRLKPDYVNPMLGRATVMYDMGRRDAAVRVMEVLCRDVAFGCSVLDRARAGMDKLKLRADEQALGVSYQARKTGP